jgi:outer membrane receptor protein involved in Fe transport
MYKKTKLAEAITIAIASGSVGFSGSALAQQENDRSKRLEEIVVTATKRAENLQDIPIAVQAMDAQMLQDLNIQGFEDWVKQAPNVNFSGRGPGQNAMYMRGITAGGGLYSSGRTESTSSVAFYVDEAAMTTTGRNIDVHLLDVQRIEILPGPQGTLYGQSSQAGTIRVVTNKPKMNEWEGLVQGTVNAISKGGTGLGLEGVINIPVIDDKLALRAVGYNIDQAGWIDNVPGTISYYDNIYFASRTVVDGAVIGERDNSDLVEKDFNTATYTGGRLTGLLNINEDWDLTVGLIAQNLDVDGVFDYSPDIGDQQISRYEPDTLKDEFIQYNWTLDGRLGMLDVVYAGAYIDQDISQWADYTTNVYDTSWLIWYNCSYNAAYEVLGCEQPNETFHLDEHKKRTQHEIRFSTDQDKRLSFIGGIWYSADEVLALQEWQYDDPSLFAPNAAYSGATTYYPPRPPETAFWNEIFQRGKELAFFGELTFDFTDQLGATVGVRRSLNELTPSGSYNTATRGDVDSDGGGSLDDHGTAKDNKTIWKFTLTYRPTDLAMFYATYSEGFRRGGFNRQGAIYYVETGELAFPAYFKSDLVDNYELGWKLTLLDDRLRWNGAAYYLDWSDQQVGIFDPPIYGITAFTANLAGSEVKGVESDFTALLSDNVTLQGAVTFLNGEITDLPENARGLRPVGSDLSRVPNFSGTLNLRTDFEMMGRQSFWTIGTSHTGSMIQGLSASDAIELGAYTTFDASIGMDFENWQVRLIGSNLTDERPELTVNDDGGPKRIRSARPRTFSVRATYNF